MSYNADVDVVVEVAFGDGVYETSQSWVDVTDTVREFSTQRGRSRILDDVQPGAASLTLSNHAADYSPWNTQGTYAGDVNVLTQVRIRAEHDSTTYGLFHGYAVGWPASWPASGKDAVVRLSLVDGFHLLAMVETELTESKEMSGTRVGNLLDVADWPASWRTLDTGVHNVAALTAEFNSVLSEIKRARLVEDGLFYIDGSGNAVFLDGVTRLAASPSLTFSDDGGDLKYADLQVSYDDAQLWNQATVTRRDGLPQTATDTTSITAYGQRDLHLSETLHVGDGEANAQAEWLVEEFKDIRPRVDSLVLIPDSTDLWTAALGTDFWTKATVERTDVAGDPFEADCFIEGVSHVVTMVGQRSWTTTFQLSPDLPYDDWWVLGTSELGVDTRLSY